MLTFYIDISLLQLKDIFNLKKKLRVTLKFISFIKKKLCFVYVYWLKNVIDIFKRRI